MGFRSCLELRIQKDQAEERSEGSIQRQGAQSIGIESQNH